MTQEGSGSAAALVTAGARRVGKTLALRLAAIGYDIALHYCSSQKDAEETGEEIEKLGRRCFLIQADFQDNEQLQSVIPRVFETMPKLNVLVNNASAWNPGKFLDSSLEELAGYLRVHLEAPFILTRDFAKLAKQGQIVNIVDSNISKNRSDNFSYLLSKKALYDFTLMAAAELAPQIKVNAIAPGAVLTPEDERKTKYAEKFGKNPLERPGSPDDVADALEFLLKSNHTTGQVIYVAGGKHLG